MPTPAKQASDTPILDLLQPLPDPDTEKTTERFVGFPFLAFCAFIAFTGNYGTLAMFLCLLPVKFVVIAVHEFGHLIAGWSVGFRFKSVQIDPFRIKFDSGRWNLKIRPRLSFGLASMSLDRVRRIRRRLIVFVAGGPAASILFGVAAIVSGEFAVARYDSPWPAFLEFAGAWSLFIGCLGLIPYQVRGYANDAMILRALFFSKAEATQLIASYAFTAPRQQSLLPADYFRRWMRLAAIPSRLVASNYGADWAGYESATDAKEAAIFLERCLAASGTMDDDQRDKLIAEAAVFTALRRNDAPKAEIWFKRIRSTNRLGPIWAARAKIALLCAHGQLEQASFEINCILSLIREFPDSAERRRFEDQWAAWDKQIHQQAAAPAACEELVAV